MTRAAAVAPGRSPLKGLVEVDETAIPCRTNDDPGGRGRSHDGKVLVAGAAHRRTRHAAFMSLLDIAVARKPTTYKMLIASEATV